MVTEILTEQIKEQLKLAVKDRFGKPLNSVKSFEELSENTHLSVQTLRRFFGKIDLNKKVGLTSLSLLCKYVGFEDWQTFSSYITQLESISDKDKSYIENMSVFFENGERYHIDYHQNTMMVDTLNDYAKVIYSSRENFQFFYSLYQNNNWSSDYFLAWLPNYNYFGEDWCRQILRDRLRKTTNTLVKLALNNFLFFGSFLSKQEGWSDFEIIGLNEIYKKYRENYSYMPYHEMRYHTVLLIVEKKTDNEVEFQRIVNSYLEGLENSGLAETNQQELLIFFCNTLLWLQEYQLAYRYLQKAKPFLKLLLLQEKEQKAMHFFGINMVFVKTTFALAWAANQDLRTSDFELKDSDFKDITGLLYNDYIKIMYIAKCIISERGVAKKRILFQDLEALVAKTNYVKIYDVLKDLDAEFSKYSA